MAHVLIATDDLATFRVMSAECEALGHTVAWSADGQDAYIEATNAAPALVFLDASLPIFPGADVCQMLREDPQVPSGLPIYLLTDDPPSPHQLQRIQATGVFEKTHSGHALREILAHQLMHEDRLQAEREALQLNRK